MYNMHIVKLTDDLVIIILSLCLIDNQSNENLLGWLIFTLSNAIKFSDYNYPLNDDM